MCVHVRFVVACPYGAIGQLTSRTCGLCSDDNLIRVGDIEMTHIGAHSEPKSVRTCATAAKLGKLL